MKKTIQVSTVDGFLYRIRELTNNLHAIKDASDHRDQLEGTLELLSPLAITPLMASLHESGIPVSYSGHSLTLPTVIEYNSGGLTFAEDRSLLVTVYRELQNGNRVSQPLAQLHNSFLNTMKRNIIAEKEFIALVGSIQQLRSFT
jgi:hypothetical protein